MPFLPLRSTRTALRAFLAAVAVMLAAGAVAGCGEDRSNLLPGDTVNEISSNLDRVRELAGSGDCFGALTAAQEVTRQVERLGPGVDRKLKRSLRDGVTRLVLTVQENCETTEGEITEEPLETLEPSTGPTGETATEEPEETPETGTTGRPEAEDQPGGGGQGGNQGGNQGNPGGNQPTPPQSGGGGSGGSGGGGGTPPGGGGSGTGGVGPGTGGVGPPAG